MSPAALGGTAAPAPLAAEHNTSQFVCRHASLGAWLGCERAVLGSPSVDTRCGVARVRRTLVKVAAGERPQRLDTRPDERKVVVICMVDMEQHHVHGAATDIDQRTKSVSDRADCAQPANWATNSRRPIATPRILQRQVQLTACDASQPRGNKRLAPRT